MPAQTYRLLMTADLNGDAANGFFNLGDANRQWLVLNNGQWTPANGAAANSNSDGWGPTLSRANQDQVQFAVQVLNAPTGFQASNVAFVIAFSRLSNALNSDHLTASPFVNGNGNASPVVGPGLTVVQDSTIAAAPTFYITAPVTYTTTPARRRPLQFEMSLTVTLTLPGGDIVYLSYDPELDVDVNS